MKRIKERRMTNGYAGRAELMSLGRVIGLKKKTPSIQSKIQRVAQTKK